MKRSLAPLAAVVLLAACGGGSGTRAADHSPVPSSQATPSADEGTPSAGETVAASPTAAPTRAPTRAAGTTGPTTGTTSSVTKAPTSTKLALTKLGSFDSPVWVGAVPGDTSHLFLVQKTGKVLRLDASGKALSTVLDVSDQLPHGNEQGLLSIAFDPGYSTNHRLYAYMNIANGDIRVMAYTVTGNKAGSGQQLLAVEHHDYSNHNGGLLLFDRTGELLVGIGDGGSGGDPQNHAQDLTSNLGKILRLDPQTGAGASDNPYSQNTKVWAYGLRNPWRFSFNTNGDLYVGDVGQDKIEELDVVPLANQKGANYGWSVYEGNSRYHDDRDLQGSGQLINPVLTYTHASGGCSITGGEVYHGKALPQLVGHYVFGDYCAGKLLQVTRTANGVSGSSQLGLSVDGLQAFGHDAAGELLVMSADTLYRLT